MGLQGSQLYSLGRATYGRLGRDDVDANSDLPVPKARAVGRLDGVAVTGMAAGMSFTPQIMPPRHV